MMAVIIYQIFLMMYVFADQVLVDVNNQSQLAQIAAYNNITVSQLLVKLGQPTNNQSPAPTIQGCSQPVNLKGRLICNQCNAGTVKVLAQNADQSGIQDICIDQTKAIDSCRFYTNDGSACFSCSKADNIQQVPVGSASNYTTVTCTAANIANCATYSHDNGTVQCAVNGCQSGYSSVMIQDRNRRECAPISSLVNQCVAYTTNGQQFTCTACENTTLNQDLMNNMIVKACPDQTQASTLLSFLSNLPYTQIVVNGVCTPDKETYKAKFIAQATIDCTNSA